MSARFSSALMNWSPQSRNRPSTTDVASRPIVAAPHQCRPPGCQLGHRSAVHPFHPAGQMALMGEACGGCDLGQRQFAIAHQFDGAAKAQVNDVAIGTDADLTAKYPRKMELAAAGHSRQRGD